MSVYNPYSKYPDVGQGINDMVMQLVQMMMMKKMMGGGGQQTTQLGQTPAPQGGMMPPNPQTPWMRQGASGVQLQPSGKLTGNIGQMAPGGGGMTPEQLQQLLPLLAQALGLR